MATGIKDKVAILGMGCSKFGERWDKEADDLMVEAYTEALADAGIDTKQIDAAWLATAIEEQHVGKSGVPLAVALRLPFIPVTRVENYCASGTEAFRGAVYAVASGAADIALALGVEKLKDTGYGGLPQRGARPAQRHDHGRTSRRPAASPSSPPPIAPSTASTAEDLKRAMAHISVKSHDNGAANPKAHLRNKITVDTVLQRADDRRAARPVRLLRRVATAPPAPSSPRPRSPAASARPTSSSVKALQLAVSNGLEAQHNSWDGSYFATTRIAAKRAYQEAGIDDPRDRDQPDRGARLLLGHRARDHGGPAHLAGRRRREGRARRLLRCRRRACPARSTAASNASAIRSAPRACA